MKKVAIIGHFGFGKEYLDGQTVKTQTLADELINQFGDGKVSCIDTHGGVKATLKILLKCVSSLKNHENVVTLPAHNGLKIIIPWLNFVNNFFKRRIHYVVIGGWLSEFLKDKKWLEKKLKKLDRIYVETTSMKNVLDEMAFTNTVVMPNCKNLNILKEDELVYPNGEPYKLCTFSRVMKEKGIEDAVNAVKSVNKHFGRTVYTLDIYGQIDGGQTEWFENLKADFPEYVKYGGLVPFDKSVEVLKDYFALLFPTYYGGEGFAGTLIDAFASGVPVIVSDWKYNGEIVCSGKNGIVYSLDEANGLEKILTDLVFDSEIFVSMKKQCLHSAEDYLPKNVIEVLIKEM